MSEVAVEQPLPLRALAEDGPVGTWEALHLQSAHFVPLSAFTPALRSQWAATPPPPPPAAVPGELDLQLADLSLVDVPPKAPPPALELGEASTAHAP